MAQFIYTMIGVSKVVPPDRKIIRDISLSFFPGAKIGLLGLNGAGKSTVLRIMAGVDSDFEGEARPQPGIRIGYLPQEPELDESKTVREVVEEGVAETRALLNRFDEVSMKFAEPMSDDEMNALLAEQAELQEAIENANGWELERTLEVAADALRLPEWDASVAHLSGGERRRAAICRLLLAGPDMLLLDEPTNHLDLPSQEALQEALHAGLALGAAPLGVRAHPLELRPDRTLARFLAAFFLRQALLFLLQPGRVIAFPRNAVAAVQFQDPLRRVVEKVAVMRDRHDGA
jgi:ATPase subunit of ABC transporter with duplicated ATPase domains